MNKPGSFVVSPKRHDPKPIDWIDNKFIHITELFPCWYTASIMLTDFVRKTGDWLVVSEQSDVSIGLEFQFVWDLVSRRWVPMLDFFPPEDRPKVEEICHKVMDDYTPDLTCYLHEKVTEETKNAIYVDIKAFEMHVISCGGRQVKEELAFRFGLLGI